MVEEADLWEAQPFDKERLNCPSCGAFLPGSNYQIMRECSACGWKGNMAEALHNAKKRQEKLAERDRIQLGDCPHGRFVPSNCEKCIAGDHPRLNGGKDA